MISSMPLVELLRGRLNDIFLDENVIVVALFMDEKRAS
jgi:hypothetical protein